MSLLAQITERAQEIKRTSPLIRQGQALMHATSEICRPLYLEIIGTNANCDLNSTRIPEFKIKVKDYEKESAQS